ncbi:hypothetical protein KQX54_000687 [Cotesia glomerata]|uniref:Uncharacterized protein n=1 Tax=Cotesia glomerata TaxID=32391 RepID=A0AAV7J0R2_COTGL|nr:hypothetical protein KQX54_000687 [Cotesia glomerata]
MFEKFNVPAMYICKNAVLAAYANGRSTAMVVDSGATHTSAVPVHDGYMWYVKETRLVGRRASSRLLLGLVYGPRSSPGFSNELPSSDGQSHDEDAANALPMKHFEFPTGYNDDYGAIRLMIPEALFDPSNVKVLGPVFLESVL